MKPTRICVDCGKELKIRKMGTPEFVKYPYDFAWKQPYYYYCEDCKLLYTDY